MVICFHLNKSNKIMTFLVLLIIAAIVFSIVKLSLSKHFICPKCNSFDYNGYECNNCDYDRFIEWHNKAMKDEKK